MPAAVPAALPTALRTCSPEFVVAMKDSASDARMALAEKGR